VCKRIAGYIGISSPSEAWADQWEMGDDWEVVCTSIFLKDIVTYSGFSIHDETLLHSKKVNTLQLNTVGNSWNTRTRPTRTVSEH
jgi:hypothetical protein